MRRAWKCLGVAGAGLLIVAGLALGLPYTEVGSRWLLAGASGFLPESLTYESFDGALAGPFEVRGLEYSFGRLSGRIEFARVHWQPWQLLGKTVQLDSVMVTGAWLKWDTTHVVRDRDSTGDDQRGTPGWKVFCDQLSASGGVFEGPYGLTLHEVQLTSEGSIDSFQVSLGSKVSHDSLPEFALAFAGQGDLKHVEFSELLLTRDSSQLALQGLVEWKPVVAWVVRARGEALDPSMWSRHLDRMHGSVRLSGRSSGRMEAGATELTLVVDSLSGVLDNSQVRGCASVEIRDGDVEIDSSWIDWHGISAYAYGRYADSVHLVWEASVPDLSLLCDSCAGSVQAQGEAYGPVEALAVNAEFGGSSVVFREYRAGAAEGRLSWNRGDEQPSKLTVRLDHVRLPDWEFDSVSFEADGTRAAHQARIAFAGTNGSLNATAQGAYDSLWHGSLNTLALNGVRVGSWRLISPAEVEVGTGHFRSSELCFEGDRGRLCAAGKFQSRDQWGLDAQLDSVALDALSTALLTDVLIDSRLSGTVHMSSSAGSGVSAEAELTLARGLVIMKALPEDTITADSLSVSLHLAPDSSRLSARGGMSLRGEHMPFRLECGLPGTARLATEFASDSVRWLALPWSVTADVDPLALGYLDPWLPKDSHLDGLASLHLEAASNPDGTVLGNCVLNLPPGHMQVWTGTDTLVLDWTASVLELRADSTGTSAQAHSALRTGGTDVGTLDVSLRSPQVPVLGENPLDLPLTGTAGARIELAPLEPFAAGVTGLKGEFNVQTNITGTPRDLALEGSLELSAEAFLQDLGIQLSAVRLSMQASGGSATVSGSATSGGGTLELSGTLNRLPSREAPSQLQVRGSSFLLLDSRQASVWISPDLQLAAYGDSLELTGTLLVPQARIEIVKLPEQAVAGSPDVVIVGDTVVSRAPRFPFGSRVGLTLGDQVFFKGFDVTTFLNGSLDIRQKPGAEPEARGEVVLREGRYRGMGQDLQIDPGRLIFSGPLFDPAIDVLAYRRAADHTKAGFKVSGRLTSPQVDLYSDPMKPEQDIMSYILFGRSSGAGSESERLKASEAAALLGGNLLAAQAATQIGLDEARIDPGYTGTDAALVAGKYLSPQLFVGYGTGLFETLHTLRVRYIVSTHISLQAETGTRETADVIYQIERGD